ncbi:all-trans retinoic acid-induced differentiation factor isoform X2 [Protopterus annectens]|uniref:all-trans retinoic acid-induced differentiation factor isoform X2 n=1 Tax=Protopterus annectens TaxID=7888 RepID=UPI001CFAA6DC|nr:all-trans retinoic acid-induced differentiation factor isoform X2 [Protopterus annectens]
MAVRGGSVVYRYLLRLLVLHSFILIFSVLGSGIRVCSICPGEIRNGSAVAEFCYSNSSFVSERRCCLKKQNSQVVVVGLDFGNCSLSQIDTELQTASTAEVIDLTDNPLKNLPVSAFRGLVGLQYIVLPELVNCPGDDISWEEVNITANKRICKEQKNICGTTGQLGCFPHDDVLWDSGSSDNILFHYVVVHPASESKTDLLNHDTTASTFCFLKRN